MNTVGLFFFDIQETIFLIVFRVWGVSRVRGK